MKICVFGLGYVGVVTSACLAEIGHEVVGIDINPVKVEMIKDGKSPIIEAGIQELTAKMVEEGVLAASCDVKEALKGAEVVLICVGTPNEDNGSLSLKSIERTCEMIGENFRELAEFPVIILRSTVMPGTTEALVIPTLEAVSEKKAGLDFGVCFNPEFLREGTSIYDFYNPPQTVVGVTDLETYHRLTKLYEPIKAPLVKTEIKVAETIKMVCNVYHALKITFANEIGNVCKQYGVDSHHVMEVFCNDKKLNISPAYLRPGYAFGGSCLPKDIKGLLYLARQANIDIPVIEAILPSNEIQIQTALSMIVKTKKKRIGFLGLAFKEGTDDLRSSAQVELIERLIGKGYHVKIYDPNVFLAKLMGANKSFIEKEIPHISSLLCETMDCLLDEAEVVVITNREKKFEEVIDKTNGRHVVIDLVRIFPDFTSNKEAYQGLSW
jgi:GDP-mannose 6-dehydrogenase